MRIIVATSLGCYEDYRVMKRAKLTAVPGTL